MLDRQEMRTAAEAFTEPPPGSNRPMSASATGNASAIVPPLTPESDPSSVSLWLDALSVSAYISASTAAAPLSGLLGQRGIRPGNRSESS